MDYGYYNGEIAPINEVKIPLNDRVVYFGDGVYDATMAYNGTILDMDAHIERFYSSLGKLRIPVSLDEPALRAELLRMAALGEKDSWYMLYWSATRATAPRRHAFPVDTPSNLIITLTEQSGLRDFTTPMQVVTYEDKRFEYCDIKTLNLIPSCLAAQAAAEAECDEAILHRGDIVTEGSHSNVSILKDGSFITAPTDHWILPGIARQNLIRAAREAGIPVLERHYTLAELLDADEIIMSSSSAQLSPVNNVDGRAVGGKAPELLSEVASHLAQHINSQFGFECCR